MVTLLRRSLAARAWCQTWNPWPVSKQVNTEKKQTKQKKAAKKVAGCWRRVCESGRNVSSTSRIGFLKVLSRTGSGWKTRWHVQGVSEQERTKNRKKWTKARKNSEIAPGCQAKHASWHRTGTKRALKRENTQRTVLLQHLILVDSPLQRCKSRYRKNVLEKKKSLAKKKKKKFGKKKKNRLFFSTWRFPTAAFAGVICSTMWRIVFQLCRLCYVNRTWGHVTHAVDRKPKLNVIFFFFFFFFLLRFLMCFFFVPVLCWLIFSPFYSLRNTTKYQHTGYWVGSNATQACRVQNVNLFFLFFFL